MFPLIKAKNVKQVFGKKVIFQDVHFTMKRGEIIGLLGPSGSGKTSLIKALIGMTRPSEGEIEVFGIKQPSLKPMGKIGYMAQADALYEELTARANLAYFGRLYGLRGKRLNARIEECLAFVGLDEEQKKPIQNYSGGMKRRLSLAISLIHQPELIFLDEPTVGIDPALKRTFWAEFGQLRDEGMSFLISTHVMDEAEHCDRIFLLTGGTLIDAGTPAAIKEKYGSMEEAFLKVGEQVCKS